MHKWMKLPFLAVLTVLILLLSAGCGSNSASPNKAPSVSAEGSNVANNSPTSVEDKSKPAEQVELLVSAAASLTESLDQIKSVYEAEHSHVKLTFNYAASGTLQQQIEQGAPADLFLSAGTKQMNALIEKGLMDDRLTTNLLTNELVLVVPQDGSVQIEKMEDLAKLGDIAIGTPESVPAGKYAQQTLNYHKLWDSLQSKLVLTKDVKQVLSYVETGNVDAGFVYKTDAALSDKVKVALSAEAESHEPIEYPIGVLKDSGHPDEAKALYDFLLSDPARQVFSTYGFTPAE
ncbi:molybdate ABC transporter substrate-binding protein [Paenibacillus sp. DXFW5]|uniref:Molybdate ABC transporter substrate-binding protein n=1 Tax=Paenibacillus rhizolycopersici TaxID=2780073 RepID=A0ABS2H1X3_9BACL|nr:molybdate ABC transporter substrate-binding protein [Paenibacillus rhizolycopersici]MBM6995410.1 molybdate ABC transporter substrate-binding protein [Paenibacillus rhizolycopersici]